MLPAWASAQQRFGADVRRFVVAVAAAALVGLAVGGPGASPAGAHDVLVGSSPEDGATVTKAPDVVTLTFNNAIQDRFAQVAVLDEAETPVHDGEAEVSGPTVTQAVGDLPDGAYTVSYRIISSDGHPVSGELSFSVDAEGSPGDEASEPSADETEPGDSETSDAETGDTATAGAEEDSDDDGPSTLVVMLVVVLAALVVAGVAFVAVGGRRGGDQEDTGS